MKKALAILLSSIMVLSLAACASQPAATTAAAPAATEAAPAATTAAPAAPAEKDIVKIVLEDSISTVNIHNYSATLDFWALEPLNGFLVAFNEDMEIIPYLAESWDVIGDKEIKFVLKDAKFHNGDPVKASDVKFTVDYVKNESNGCKLYEDAKVIKEVQIANDKEFTIVLDQAFPRIFELLSNFAILDEAAMGTMDSAPVGCGPFKFNSWDQDQYLKLDKNPDFWDAAKPACDGLEFYFIPEYNTSRTALLAGEVDAILYADPTDIEALAGFPSVKTYSKAITGAQFIEFDTTEPPFDDVRVRQAVNYAVDREGIIQPIYNGNGTVLYSFLDNTPYENEYFKVTRDVEKAKQLLAEAGYANGLEVSILAPNTATEGPMAELIAAQLADAGIKCVADKKDVATFLDQWDKKDFEMAICGDTGAGDPDFPTYKYTVSYGSSNHSSWSNAEYDELMEKGRACYSLEERKPIYDAASKICAEETPWIILCIENRTAALATDIEGFIMKPNLRYDFKEIHHK